MVQLLDAYFDGKKNITAGPAEAVILGAIVQAGVLSGDESEDWGCIFPDVNGLSLGVVGIIHRKASAIIQYLKLILPTGHSRQSDSQANSPKLPYANTQDQNLLHGSR